VIIATERVGRPSDFTPREEPRRGGPCAFCAGHEHETPPEILAYREPRDARADGPGWRVRVVPNKFPALRIEGALERRGQGLYDLMNGVGAHEVLIESPDHDHGLGRLPPAAVEDVLRAVRDRVVDLRRDDRFRSVVVFKNHGAAAGASLEHPHMQLIATPIVPLVVADELLHARAYHDYRERCLFCDILSQELAAGVRLVGETPEVVAFAPFAARFPFETWILPRRHGATFETTNPETLRDLARLVRSVLGRLDRAIGDPPYNLFLHSAPFGTEGSPSYHWHVEIVPKLVGVAGFEWGSGFHINPMPPENAARTLRNTPE
jgi:UDPglucose--hexose-1-phosphate uridylyltransferase